MHKPRWIDASRAPLALLVIGVALSAGGAWQLHRSAAAQARAVFEREVDHAQAEVAQRLRAPLQAMRSAESVYLATRSLDTSQFRALVDSHSLATQSSGVLMLGVALRVPQAAVAAYAVSQVEPLAGNEGVLGLDLGADPALRSGIENAIDKGMPAFLPIPAGAAPALGGAGLLLVHPLYQPDTHASSADTRRAALAGLVFAPVDVGTLLAHGNDAGPHAMALRLSGRVDGAERLLAAVPAQSPGPAVEFESRRSLDLPGLQLDLAAARNGAAPAFAAGAAWSAPWLLFGLGSLASLLATAGLRALATSRERAEALARGMTAELDRLALVARATSNAVIITDVARRITWVNAGFERITGYTAAEAMGRSPAALLQCEATDAGTVRRIRESLNRGRVFAGELLNRSKSGRDYWVEVEIQPTHDAQGALTGFMAIQSDVTERRLAEQAQRAGQALLDQTGRIGGVGGFALQFDTMEMQWTAQTCRLLGVDADPVPTLQDVFALCTPAGREELIGRIEAGPGSHVSWDFELPLLSADGRALTVRVVAELAFNDGGPVRLVGALHDMTERRSMLAEVQRSAALLRGAFDAIDEPFVLFDPEDRLVFCNDKYRAIYAASADLIFPGARFEDIVRGGAERGQYPDAVGRVEEWMVERVAAHRSGDGTLLQRVAGGRTIRIVERRMPDGHTVGFRIDLTDLIRVTEAAEAANRAKSDFIGTMSHELRTPLQSIIGFSELGRHFARDQPRFEAMFADIHSGGRRMLTLVNGLLDVSKIDGAQSSLAMRRVSLVPLLHAVAAELRTQLAQRELTIVVPAAEPPRFAELDEFRFQQVVRNVLANAIRFSPVGARIEVTLAPADDGATEIAFRDHGPGIPADELDSIFEPFVQSTRTRDGAGGTGLGLTICRRIMRAHGGSIEAANAPGGGTVMRVRLPGVAFGPADPEAASAPTAPPTATSRVDALAA